MSIRAASGGALLVTQFFEDPMDIYLASPTGFSPEHKTYRDRVKARLVELGHVVLDPWDTDFSQCFQGIDGLPYAQRMAYNGEIGRVIGRQNHRLIERSKAVLGILDGTEPDSGTVGEVCFAAGRGKVAYGLRTDWRDSGDMAGLPINLQVLYFIQASGGYLYRSVEAIDIPLTPSR